MSYKGLVFAAAALAASAIWAPANAGYYTYSGYDHGSRTWNSGYGNIRPSFWGYPALLLRGDQTKVIATADEIEAVREYREYEERYAEGRYDGRDYDGPGLLGLPGALLGALTGAADGAFRDADYGADYYSGPGYDREYGGSGYYSARGYGSGYLGHGYYGRPRYEPVYDGPAYDGGPRYEPAYEGRRYESGPRYDAPYDGPRYDAGPRYGSAYDGEPRGSAAYYRGSYGTGSVRSSGWGD